MNWLAGWKVAYAVMGAVSFLWGAALLFVHIDEAPVGHDGTAGGPGGGGGNGFALGTVVLFFWIVTLGGSSTGSTSSPCPPFSSSRRASSPRPCTIC
jgi:hypothetical protein